MEMTAEKSTRISTRKMNAERRAAERARLALMTTDELVQLLEKRAAGFCGVLFNVQGAKEEYRIVRGGAPTVMRRAEYWLDIYCLNTVHALLKNDADSKTAHQIRCTQRLGQPDGEEPLVLVLAELEARSFAVWLVAVGFSGGKVFAGRNLMFAQMLLEHFKAECGDVDESEED